MYLLPSQVPLLSQTSGSQMVSHLECMKPINLLVSNAHAMNLS